MKILFLSDLLSYGGASKLINDMLPRLKNRGHVCAILILNDTHSKYAAPLRDKGFKVDVVPAGISGHPAKIKYIKNYIKNSDCDVAHANLFPMFYYCAIAKRSLGSFAPAVVMTEHSTDNKRRRISCLRTMERYIYSSYDKVVSVSGKTEEKLLGWLKLSEEQRKGFTVIDNGIDINYFRNAQAYSKESLFDNYKNGDALIGLVGSFTPQKNHKSMIAALSKLPDNYKLLLIGEGPLQEAIARQVNENKLAARVRFLGFRKDVAQIMHTVDMVVIPSIWEGFGLVAAEAVVCKTPIVSSDAPGLSEVVSAYGVKCNPLDSDDICRAVTEVSAKGHAFAPDCYADRFGIDRMVGIYEKLYRELLGKKSEEE